MKDENITYAKGRIYELKESIQAQQLVFEPIKKAISHEAQSEIINTQKLRSLLDEYDIKADKLSQSFKELYKIKEKWGIK